MSEKKLEKLKKKKKKGQTSFPNTLPPRKIESDLDIHFWFDGRSDKSVQS